MQQHVAFDVVVNANGNDGNDGNDANANVNANSNSNDNSNDNANANANTNANCNSQWQILLLLFFCAFCVVQQPQLSIEQFQKFRATVMDVSKVLDSA